MNNFNNIFIVIRKLADTNGIIQGADCFERIAREANLPTDKIEFLLKTLQDIELIKFSMENHYIKLTAFGKKQERLFSGS